MNIFSKELLIQTGPPPVYTYEAYYVNNGTLTSLGTITDPSKTFSPDDFIYSNIFVVDGDLYENGTKVTTGRNITSLTGRTTSSSYYGYFVDGGKLFSFNSSLNITQIGSATDWIKVCGYAGGSGYRAFAEASDGLYMVYGTTSRSRISTLTGWTKITGYSSESNANYFGYGINDGKLYYLYANGNGAVQQGSDTTWSDITGSYENGSWYGYGINNGKLYQLKTTRGQIGTDTSWTKVSGTDNNSIGNFAVGIESGKLYRLDTTNAYGRPGGTYWIGCSGFYYYVSSGSVYALAYDNTALYGMENNGSSYAVTKLMDGDWIYCGGCYSNSTAYGLAIRRIRQ